MTTCKEKRKMEIQNLILSGYTHQQISSKLNISLSTVTRTVRKLREGSEQWLSNLAKKDFANIYRESLEGLNHDMMHLNELLEDESVKNNVKLQLQIRREITNIRSKYLGCLLQGPMVWSLDALVKNSNLGLIPMPTMEALGGISGVK